MSSWTRIVGVFTKPVPTFEDISRRPTCLLPIVLIIVMELAFGLALGSHIGWDRMARQSFEKSTQAQRMSPAEREQVKHTVRVEPAPYFVGTVVRVPVSLLVTAVAVIVLTNVVFRAGIRFKQVFAVVSYSFLPGISRGLAVILMMLARPAEKFDPQRGTMLDAGFYLGQAGPKWLQWLAASVDVFSIWILLLIATGLRAASTKLTWAQGFLAVLIPWLLYIGFKVWMATLV